MATYTVGKDVLSYCGKCKLALSHIIVTMKSPTAVGKVQCNTCKASHNYKDPSKANKAKRKVGGRKTKSTVPIADIWMEAVEKAKGDSIAYSIKKKFSVGDLIDHPKFGPGVVEEIVDNDKLNVIFRHTIKTLIHDKN